MRGFVMEIFYYLLYYLLQILILRGKKMPRKIKRRIRFFENNHPSLDLHLVRHKEVRSLLITFIESHWNSGEVVDIITGNSNEMKRIVGEVLQEYQLDYRIGHPLNPNCTGMIQATLD